MKDYILPLDPNQRSTGTLEFQNSLRSKIVGQDEGVQALVDLYQVFCAGLNSPGRPVGNLLFLGPTGSGKTRIVEAAAEILFGDPRLLIKVECIEQQRLSTREEDAAERLARAAMAIDIEDVGNIEITGAHEVTDIAIRCEVLLVVLDSPILFLVVGGEFADSRLKRSQLNSRFVSFGPQAGQFRFGKIVRLAGIAKLLG